MLYNCIAATSYGMISSIKGEIQYISEDSLEILSGSIGYKVFCPKSTLLAYSTGQEAEIFTYFHVRENAQDLYGFKDRDERGFFEILIGISGIGPKGALGILQAAPLDLLKRAIVSEDTSVLTRVSGIGQKTAERIIMELKGKLEGMIGEGGGDLREGGDVIEALTGLGYTRAQAQSVLREISKDIEGVENKVKEALKILSK